MRQTRFPSARVLIVDDQPSNTQFLEGLLEAAGYAHFLSLTDPRLVAPAAREFRPDLILLDLMMPHLDGFAVLDQLRPWLGGQGYLPVLVLTADATPETRLRALASGAHDFLTKPLDAVEALLRAHNLLETRFLYERQRRAADARIQELAALVDRASDAIFVLDMANRITSWNKGAEALYGWSPEEAVGRDATALLMRRPPPELAAAEQALLAHGKWMGELGRVSKDGRELTVSCRWSLMSDEGGRPTAKLMISSDVTERRKLETQLAHAQRLESIGLLAGGIAHDLNNMLSPILMGAEMLKAGAADATSRMVLDTVLTSARHAADLVRQILTFSRGGDGKPRPLRLGPLLADLMRMLQQTLPKSIVIELTAAPDLWQVTADATQMHQVLMNLCVNARDAMRDGGRLTLAAGNQWSPPGLPPGPYVRLCVADTGAGMPPDVLHRIFEPFFTTKEVGRGTGLGLSMVHGIVAKYGGAVTVESEPGRGARFFVHLPALVEAAGDDARAAPRAWPTGGGELVLVVDDEAAIRHMAALTLEAAGYRVVMAQDGAEAVAVYAQRQDEVRLVFTDMAMPVMDGRAAVGAIRGLNPRALIVATSGTDLSDLGVQATLPKPYTPEGLLGAVSRALRG